MKLNLLFMDECYCPNTSITSLTGLLVPAQEYAGLRIQFYDTLQWAIRPAEHVIAWPPELHASQILPGENDERRLQMLEKVVDLVVSNHLKVYRVGHFVTKNLEMLLAGDRKMIGLCWFGMVAMLQPEFENEMLVPIMDGFDPDTVRKFSHLVKNGDVYRAAGLSEASLGFHNTQNIIGEVFYADSQYSIFTQVVDVISYLRHVADWEREGIDMTDFKKRLLPIAKKLKPSLAREEIVAMNGERPARRNN
jgi:hypothetical protein